MNESTFTPGGGQPGMPAPDQEPAGFAAVGSVAVRTFAAHRSHRAPGVTLPAHQSMDGHHVNAMAGDAQEGICAFLEKRKAAFKGR